MKNPKKAISALGIGSGVTAAAALVSVGVLLSLHNSYSVPREQTYQFLELQKQVIKIQDALKKLSQEQLQNDQIKKLSVEVDFANQLLSNEDSSIGLMLQQRNKLRHSTPKALLNVAKDPEEEKNLINDYYSLVKDDDFQNIIKSAKDKVLSTLSSSSSQNKQEALKNFYKVVDPLIERQNEFSLGLETKIWTNHEQLVKNSKTLFSTQEKSVILSTIDQILSLLAKPQYSRDLLVEYEKVYDQMIDKLSKNKTEENQFLNNFLENIIRVRKEINVLNVNNNLKNTFLQRIDDYKNTALNPTPTLAITKAEEITYLNDLVNNQLKTLISQTPENNKLIQILSEELNNLINTVKDSKFQKLVSKQIQRIQENPQDTQSNLLNSISQANNLTSTIKNIQNLSSSIKDQISEHLSQKSLSSDDAKSFLDQLDVIVESNFDNISEYLQRLNTLNNNIYDNVLLGNVFKNALKKLNDQILVSLEKGLGVNKTLLALMSSEIDSLLSGNASLKQLNESLQTQSNQLREINRLELQNWYKRSTSILDTEIKVDQKIKDKLTFLNSKAIKLIPENSTAIRDEMQLLIAQYREELQKANISEELQKTLDKYSDTKDRLFNIFGKDAQGNIDSPFGAKLFDIAKELKKQAEITASNPNLSSKEKDDKFKELQQKLEHLLKNGDAFKELEESVLLADKALASSQGKSAETAFLEKEALKIKQLQNNVVEALNDAANSNNVKELIDQINQATKDYKDKQAQYQSGTGLNDNFKTINDIFAPYSLGGAPTPMQKKILNKLSEYQQQLASSNLTNEQREQINNKIAQLMDALLSAKDLEVKNNSLKTLISDTENKDYATFKPQSQFDSAKSLTEQIDAYIETLFNPDFDKNEISNKVNDLENQSQRLSLDISVALLQKTNQEILNNKITGANANLTPYVDINNSLETINTQTQTLINNQNKTQAQVDDLENNIKNYLKLAKALKSSADKLQNVTQSINPIAYEKLVKSINNIPSNGTSNQPTNSLIHFNDSISVIDFKIRILTAEVSKTQTRIEAENNIKTLEAVYGQTQRNHVIFDDAIRSFDTQVADYKTQLAQFYSTNVNLASLRDEIDFYTKKEITIRDAIQKQWDDALALKEQLKNQYDQRKNADGIANITHTNEVLSQFDTLKDAIDNNGKKTTTTEQLLAKLDELPLAYTKDGFVNVSAELNDKLNLFDNYSNNINTTYSNPWKRAILTWNNALKNTVNNYSNINDLTKIKLDYQKISALNSVISQLKVIFDYFDNNSKSDPNQKNFVVLNAQRPNNTLFAKLNQSNNYVNADVNTLYSNTPESIITFRNELRDVYFDNVSIEDAKASEIQKINTYKNAIDAKLDALNNNNNHIDTNLKTQIDAKLNEFLNRVNAVQQKNELIAIDNDFSQIQFKEESLKNLAIKTSEAQNLVNNNNNTSANSAGKQSILNSISAVYTAYQGDYLSLDSNNLIAKEQDLETKIALFNKFVQVSNLIQSEKAKIPMHYAEGTGNQGTPQDGLTKMQGYYDHLMTMLDVTPVTQAQIFSVENTINSLAKLITLQKDKLNTQAQVLGDSAYNNFAYKNTSTANYGFDQDAKLLADAILKSIPDNNKSATDIENTLIPNLNSEFENAHNLYIARKNALDTLYKDNANDQGIKTKEVDQLKDPNTSNIQVKYNTLKAKADDFFHAQATTIQNANNKATIENALQNVIEFDVFFEKYKNIANLVADANEKITQLTSQSQAIQNNDKLTASKTKLQNAITTGEGYYFTQKDGNLLDQNALLIDTYIARLNLALEVAKLQNQLNDFNTTPGSNDYLTAQAKTPLSNIINSPFTELDNDPTLETKDNYDNLAEKYLTGSSNSSYAIAFSNSKLLQQNIFKANEYLNTYKTHLATNADYEPQNIKDLYTQLETKITEANVALENSTHNETQKLQLASELYNSNNGILDNILRAEREKAKSTYMLHLDLDKFLNNHFPNPNNTPKLQDYETIAIDPIKSIDISTAAKLENFNTQLASAKDKYLDQRVALFQWEANRYNSFKEKFNQFYDFLNAQNTNGATKEFILEVTGITQNDLNNFNNAANPNAVDTLHTNAQNYAQRASQSQSDIKSWITNQSNDVIETLENVATELASYYQNLISIKSIPSILLAISNLDRIKEELQDSSNNHNVRFALKTANLENNDLTSKINAYLTDIGSLATNAQSDIRTEADDSNTSFASSNNANITTARTNYFNKYKDIVVALAKAKANLDNLVFGNTQNDVNTLQNVLHKFIEGVTGFDGRASVNNILKYIADTSQLAISGQNDKFSAVKSEYEKIANPSLETEQALNNLQKSASDFDIYSTLTRGFGTALQLFDWMNDQNNYTLFFDWLSKSSQGILNYENISAKDSTSLENFANELNNVNIPEENLNIDGTTFKAKKLNSQFNSNLANSIGNLFDKFNILKGNGTLFNTDNIEVFVYKSTVANAQYVVSRLTADPSIKRGFVNLYFRFNKPTSLNNNASAFGTVNNFGIKFENVGISFKTLDEFIIHKENIQDVDHLNETLFTAEEAGWNNLQAPSRLLSSFNKYSLLKSISDNTYFYTEDITEDINAPLSGTTNSSPDFRVKVQLTGLYKGYQQVGRQIFWKTLNPNFASDTGIQYQNQTSYSQGLIGTFHQNQYHWADTYQYQYDANKDSGKNLLFLPIVIGIPVFKNNTNDGTSLMVISWQILNRFDKNPTSAPQNISLGSADVLRRVFFFRRTREGKRNTSPTFQNERFFEYVMSKIRIRDLEGLTFKDLSRTAQNGQNGSSLWSADRYVESVDDISGKGGVGDADFYQAIGSNGKFDIKFKLH
ncbi:Uncharacterised protein [Mycoplasmopsis citelli]|uniref:Uncharacterized protein n=1 Tax=Mycoplasmopsis citelli TaxID=171281 RepID=A0A449B177_9BACT|nr:hypothetical protein [Mycoplasmopsis citelli]VEU74352.1 Uncharacterised protein [Mycoplasmopsis citelli]